MGALAKPMICPNLRMGSPLAIATTAILCPRGTRALATMPELEAPFSTLSTATTILSAELSLMVRGTLVGGSTIFMGGNSQARERVEKALTSRMHDHTNMLA